MSTETNTQTPNWLQLVHWQPGLWPQGKLEQERTRVGDSVLKTGLCHKRRTFRRFPHQEGDTEDLLPISCCLKMFLTPQELGESRLIWYSPQLHLEILISSTDAVTWSMIKPINLPQKWLHCTWKSQSAQTLKILTTYAPRNSLNMFDNVCCQEYWVSQDDPALRELLCNHTMRNWTCPPPNFQTAIPASDILNKNRKTHKTHAIFLLFLALCEMMGSKHWDNNKEKTKKLSQEEPPPPKKKQQLSARTFTQSIN